MRVLADVAVTITTPNLTSFNMAAKTDAKGVYGTLLPDCTMPYHFKFEKEGYLPFDLDKKIPIGEAISLNAKLTSKTEAQTKAAAAAAPQMSSNDKAVVAFNQGVEAMQAGDKAAAETKFLDAVKQNPDLPAGWQALAQMAYEKQDWAKAIEYGQKATDLDPSLTELYRMMADAATKSGDKKAAAEFSGAVGGGQSRLARDPLQQGHRGVQQGQDEGRRERYCRRPSRRSPISPTRTSGSAWPASTRTRRPRRKSTSRSIWSSTRAARKPATAKEILPLLK